MTRAIETLAIGRQPVRLSHVDAVARRAVEVVLDPGPETRRPIEASAAVVARRMVEGPPIYGVTTGFGASCVNEVPSHVALALPTNLFRYHGIGTGALFSPEETRAILLVRAASLSRGVSGVRVELLEALLALLRADVLPCIPSEGSVGASGDLTPLSYVAACLAGERDAWFDGQVVPAREALSKARLSPTTLAPKESLAIMNGTSVMTAVAALGHARAVRLARLACALTAMAVDVLEGQASHFDARIFEAKPHPGQMAAATCIRADLGVADRPPQRDGRIQDPYSLRCAPHVVGVLVDALRLFGPVLETEISGANDNPLVDPVTSDVLHGGNFYGGHVAMVADALKAQVASVSDLLDRQLALLTNPHTNRGLPENLVAVQGVERVAHHGFKAVEIATSALTAEALKLTMPASSFSRSTEGHNQDKVSMGTIAARDLSRVLELTETVAVMHLLSLAQAADLRGPERLSPHTRLLHSAVRRVVARNDADRAMDVDVARILESYRRHELPLDARELAT